MMKQVKSKFPVRMLTFMVGLFLSISALAQTTVNGHVKDATGEPIIGASILIDGTSEGTMTDIDGNFTLNVKPGAKISISYIGYQKQSVVAENGMVITLQEDAAQQMKEVVVIGYGAVKKSDLTGSVLAMKPDSKNKGLVVNAQDMMQGKMAGVNITSSGGTPGGGATIRIRGGASLNASNDPLIVIDGVIMDNNGVKGLSNPLSMVNPQDIESFNVLKDASATAIYGSRGSNGVIIITTKKGRRGFQIDYSGSATVSMKKKTVDVLTGDEFREFVSNLNYADATKRQSAIDALGTANTDWQEEIFRTAISHDHNLTFSGQIAETVPYRLSLGYTNSQGILKTSEFERYTASINLTPSFFEDHLKISLSGKGMWAKNRYADGGAISAAIRMDPTQSVYDTTSADADNFAGFFQWKQKADASFSWPNTFNNLAPGNPVSILELKNDRAISRSFIGSADFDYMVHGFEDLRLHMTLAADISAGKQATDIDPRFPNGGTLYYGSYGWERGLKRNLQFSAYAQYSKDFNDKAKNHFDIMLGNEWSHYWRSTKNPYHQMNTYTLTPSEDPSTWRNPTKYFYSTENFLVSFFGRANWSLMDSRYMVTATVRADGASRFKKHWAWFPSFAFAWKMKEENAFKNIDWLSNLKLRLGWGMTGQQDGIGDYNYFAVYKNAVGNGVYYPIIGDGSMVRPLAYDENLVWETTTTYNVGLDWGLFNDRLTGSFDWYYRKTTDLLNNAYVPAGTNFSNMVQTNIGSMSNVGFETQIDWRAIRTKDFLWTIGYNFTYNKNKITDLTGGSDPSYFVSVGGISGGTGTTVQGHAVGYPAYSFYVYQQVYDKNGNAIEGAVVDRNADGEISSKDAYFYKSSMAPVTMGLSSRMEYKNFDFGFTLRASLGNYVFNNLIAERVSINAADIWRDDYLSNRPAEVLDYKWTTNSTQTLLSDRWVQNASFLKLDNVTLGYSFANLFKAGDWKGLSGRIYGTASNVLTLTKYKGIDPEVFGGIDNNLYPRPISFILGMNLQF